jgi:hypothetical protein
MHNNAAKIVTILIVIYSLFTIYLKNDHKVGKPGIGAVQPSKKK